MISATATPTPTATIRSNTRAVLITSRMMTASSSEALRRAPWREKNCLTSVKDQRSKIWKPSTSTMPETTARGINSIIWASSNTVASIRPLTI